MRRLVLLFCLLMGSALAAPSGRPNVVVILLDNVGQEWFGCYGSGENCTPNIDRLATTGVRVEHCYTAPVCGPSRTVLLTGRYPHSTGFTLHHDAALYSGGGLDPKREIIFPRLFRDAGYVTGISGKWQINNLYDEPGILSRHGFAESLVWPGSVDKDKVSPADMAQFRDAIRREDTDETTRFIQNIESRYWDPVFLRNEVREVHPGQFGPDLTQQFAIDFLHKHQNEPFFLYYPMMLTHGKTFTVHAVPTPDSPDPKQTEQAMFAGMVRYADKQVGAIAAELEKLGLRDNTILIVASDNGTEKSFEARFRGAVTHGGLYTLTEAGSDVALLFNSPKLIPPGHTLPLADFTDIYPTACDFADIALDSKHHVDGRSLAPCLRGSDPSPPRQWILNEYGGVRVVRDQRFKLYSDGRFFDVEADRDELHDLAQVAKPEFDAAKERLQQVLHSLPPDEVLPFPLLSQSGFKMRTEARKANVVLAGGEPWKRHAIDSSSRGADGVKLADINGDGLPDVTTGWEEGGVVRVYLNPGRNKAAEPWPAVTAGNVRDAEDAIFADLDGDGRLEVVSCTEGKTRTVFWHRPPGKTNSLLDPSSWETKSFPALVGKQWWMQCFSLNLDGANGDDLVLGSKNKGATVGWLQAPSDPNQLENWTYHALRDAGWIMSLIPRDMDADGDPDILFSDRKGSRTGVFWLENPGAKAVLQSAPWTEHAIGGLGLQVMFADAADINGDGLTDVLVAAKPNDILLFIAQPDKTWKTTTLHLQTENLGDAKAVKAADINGDGLTDIFYTCENAKGDKEGIVWLEQQKTQPWLQHHLGGPKGLKYDLMQTLDLDGDGDLDVMTCEERDQLGVIWYENPSH